MNRYNEGKIYKLCNGVDDQIYVGSTCMPLAKRYYYHKKSARSRTSPVYNYLNEIGWDHVRVILIESYPCVNKMELEKRERYWIETLKSTLNCNIPSRTCEENKSLHKSNCVKYRLTEQYRNAVKKYRQSEKGKVYMKQYSQSDKRKAYQKKYRERAKQNKKYQKTLSFMESTIQKYQAVSPIEIINYKLA